MYVQPYYHYVPSGGIPCSDPYECSGEQYVHALLLGLFAGFCEVRSDDSEVYSANIFEFCATKYGRLEYNADIAGLDGRAVLCSAVR
jgi:hypothetical protein